MDKDLLKKEIKISKWISWQNYDDFVYIIDERTKFNILLEGVAVYFWKYLVILKSVPKLLETLKNKFYSTSSDTISKDLKKFINDLVIQEVIEVI
ncbi:hypothetical protein OSSY52_13150 [Tepiditoga spiralis]|uniref:PqqD family protein n=1 Tax=Tepiditoga spiralis TaxID=2108365 RepID=A0A7G1G7L5_9BACT|nr:PqqD family peptide modification chaperone [Tepiditoga spiralis]BBE31174.1 hypothetical protein OSSY52_13150 [Tepiditoga spiralis]